MNKNTKSYKLEYDTHNMSVLYLTYKGSVPLPPPEKSSMNQIVELFYNVYSIYLWNR